MLPDNTVVEVNSKNDPADPCRYCAEAKAWLAERGIPCVEIARNDMAERQAFYDSLGLVGGDRTVPQIFLIDNVSGERFRIGGSSALKASGIG